MMENCMKGFTSAAFAISVGLCGLAPAQATEPAAMIPGAWASGEGEAVCQSAPISYSLSDGTYVVFNRFDGPLHAVGRWRVEGDTVFLTHTDAPFPESGAASPETRLTLVRVDTQSFVTTNSAGRQRIRTRCSGLTLPPGATAGEAH